MQGVARGIKKPNFEKKNFCQFGLAVLPAIEKYSMNIKKKIHLWARIFIMLIFLKQFTFFST